MTKTNRISPPISVSTVLVLAPQRSGGEPFTTSDIIAEHTQHSYRSIQRIIENQLTRLERFGIMRFEITVSGKAGRPKKVWQLNERQATLLITFLRNTDVVADFKTELVRQFYDMRSLLMERASPIWQDTRSLGKEIRRQETDTIKRFVGYAKAQGSRNAVRYYTTLSRLADATAGVVDRDKAQVVQLTTLLLVEQVIARGIAAGIEAEKPYNAIYQAVKDRLAVFSSVAALSGDAVRT